VRRVLFGLIALLALGLVYSIWRPDPAPAPAVVAAQVFTAAQPAVDSQLAASAQAREASAVEQRRLEAEAATLRELVDRQRHRAEAAERRAAQAGSAPAWRQAYMERTAEVQLVREQLRVTQVRADSLVQDTVRLARDLRLVTARLDTAVRVHIPQLTAAVAAANRCRILTVPCPTRVQAAAGGALLALLAASR
jgi:GTP cyclohydrolase II